MLIEAVILRDGDICTLCREAPVRDKTLDHLNGRRRDDRIENLILLCRACNAAEGNRARRGQRILTPQTLPIYNRRAAEIIAKLNGHGEIRDQSGARVTLERVSEREKPGVDRRGWGSIEEAANLIMEPTYRLWLFRWVKAHGFIGRNDAIDAGAEHLDRTVGRASQQTIERYFRKATSSVGWLEERRDANSQPVWGFRTGLALDALENLFERRTRAIGPHLPDLESAAPSGEATP